MNMDIILVGAGGFAQEVEQYIADCTRAGHGLYDADKKPVSGGRVVGLYYEGEGRRREFSSSIVRIENPTDYSHAHWLIAIGNAEVRRRMWLQLTTQGARFATLLHPTSIVMPTATIGRGVILCPFALVSNLCTLGDNVALNTYASVGHDATISAHSVFSPYACVNGAVTLGESCFLGSYACVTPGKTVGGFAKISAGSILFHDAEAGSMIAGNPAKSRKMFKTE